MASYSQFLGRIVTVQYRAADMLQSAFGWFVGDSGRSIFLEQHIEQRGRRNYFRWEIPYQNIHRIYVVPESEPSSTNQREAGREVAEQKAARAGAGQSASGSRSVPPLPLPPKTD